MSNELDIFNLDGDMFVDKTAAATGKDTGFYKPYPENGKDGVYSSLIRFLPNSADLTQSKIHKYYVFLTDPTSGNGFPVDCPSTVGKKSILKDMYWKLKNSTSAADQNLAKNFSRKEDYYSLIQIVEDKNSPELENTIMIFKFGKKLNEMIEAQLKPKRGESVNPFDLFEGKLFSLEVRKVGEWNNYDLCSFIGDRCSIEINGRPMEKNTEDMNTIKEYLSKGPQNLSSFAYQDWDTDTTDRVMEIIRNTVPDGRLVNEVIGGAATTAPKTPPAQKAQPSQTNQPSQSTKANEEFYSDSAVSTETTQEPVKERETVSTSASLDDLYADL